MTLFEKDLELLGFFMEVYFFLYFFKVAVLVFIGVQSAWRRRSLAAVA